MYRYFEDKAFLNEANRKCADIVNRLVQKLRKEGYSAWFFVIGSRHRNMITQNEEGKIDFDYNVVIDNVMNTISYHPERIKKDVMRLLDEVLYDIGEPDCGDSTSSIYVNPMRLKGRKTEFSLDIGIVTYDGFGQMNRLKHDKSGPYWGRAFWNQVKDSKDLDKKEKALKPKHWHKVRDAYLRKKNDYLTKNDHDHPSYVCYIEAVNDVYNECFPDNSINGVFFRGTVLM